MAINRREFIRRAIAASALVVTGFVGFRELLDITSNSGQPTVLPLLLSASSTTTTQESPNASQGSSTTKQASSTTATSQAAPSGYFLVAPMSALTGKTSAYFNHPNGGLSLLLNFNSQWKAYSATCTHQPCTVNYTGSQIYCPCHDGYFDPNNGAVTRGPPPTRLPEYGVLVQNNILYVTTRVVN
jgi:Rieske Fe-S protein